MLSEAAPQDQGATMGALSLSDVLGTALGTGVTGAIVAASVRATGMPADGLAVAFGVAVAVGLGGLLLTGRLRPHRVAAPASALSSAMPPS